MIKLNAKAIFWVLVVIWMIVIFLFSAQSADTSSNTSGQFIKSIACVVKPDIKNASEYDQEQFIEQLQHIVRKSAHFTEYAVLGVLLFIALYQYKMKYRYKFLCAWIIATTYAATDELHQLFVSGRAGRITDVCIDSLGALTGIILTILVVLGVSYIVRKKKEVNYV